MRHTKRASIYMEYARMTQLKFGWTVNMSDVPDFGIYLELAPGENKMVFELYDRGGVTHEN